MSWFFIAALIISLIMGLYLAFRSINLFNLHQDGYFNTNNKKAFWLIVLVGSLSFLLSKVLNDFSNYLFSLISNIVFTLILCFFYSILIIDILRFFKKFILKNNKKPGYPLQISYIFIAIFLFVFGLYMASYPRIAHYSVNINKPAKVESLKVIQLTDIHISETTSNHFIETMVEQVNQLQPDYVFITGDTLDLRLQPYLDKNLAEIFAKLKAKYGTFIIFGNHEHYGIEREENNSNQDVVNAFQLGNMKVLQDQVFYDNKTGIYIIGRDDFVTKKFNKERAELALLTSFSDTDKPIILLDHQPIYLSEPETLGIDIMFSGHTHAGQIFPITLLINDIYKNPWGIYQSSETQFTSIVSSGYGLWGPPIRLMTQAEIVVTDIYFTK